MYPVPGHVGMSLAGSYYLQLPYTPAIAATILVDVVDKGFKDVLDIVPYGRCWMHTLLAVLVFSSIIYYWKGREWGLSWCMGHMFHLIGDIGFIPWFYPFRDYHWPPAPNVTAASAQGVKELVSNIAAVKDATDSIHISSFHFSEAVTNVFKGNLILLEAGIFLPVLILIFYKDSLSRTYRYALGFCVFLFLTLRVAYDIPYLLHSMSLSAGIWFAM
ncbi:MAG: hypothetical protein ACOX5R_19495 [bacterium]|jgi:hypothetical protein